jgi:uncharacterized protein HemX
LLAQKQELQERVQCHINEINSKDQTTADLVRDHENLVEKLRSQLESSQLEVHQNAEELASTQRALSKIYGSFAWRFFTPILHLKKHVALDRPLPKI